MPAWGDEAWKGHEYLLSPRHTLVPSPLSGPLPPSCVLCFPWSCLFWKLICFFLRIKCLCGIYWLSSLQRLCKVGCFHFAGKAEAQDGNVTPGARNQTHTVVFWARNPRDSMWWSIIRYHMTSAEVRGESRGDPQMDFIGSNCANSQCQTPSGCSGAINFSPRRRKLPVQITSVYNVLWVSFYGIDPSLYAFSYLMLLVTMQNYLLIKDMFREILYLIQSHKAMNF